MDKKIKKSEKEWQSLLDPETYHITREKGTERAFSGEYHNSKDSGVYSCVCCGQSLFDSDDKFESGVSMGVQKKKEINDKLSLEAKWEGYWFRDELTGYSRVDMEDYVQINWKVNDNVSLTNVSWPFPPSINMMSGILPFSLLSLVKRLSNNCAIAA